VFAAVQVVPAAATAYEWGLPWLRWLALAPERLVTGTPLGDPSPLAHVADPTDLLTLPVLALVLWRSSAGTQQLKSKSTVSDCSAWSS